MIALARTAMVALAATTVITSAATQAQQPPGRSTPPAPPMNPFETPIEATRDAITVNVAEFATIPNAGDDWPRLMTLVDEPGSRRLFVSTMQGMLYSVSYDGRTVTPYLNVTDTQWGHPVEPRGNERGLQSIAFHPQFAQSGAPGYGRFYTWFDTTTSTTAAADFTPLGDGHTHDTVLLEWTARNATSPRYDGDAPRPVFRAVQPFANHNAGHLAFNPLARLNTPEFGLLYIGVADGGSGGDPYNHAQNLASGFGKILRIDPLGRNSRNRQYGIPADNPFANDGKDDTLGEIYAYGLRNPQRFSWDARTGTMYVADIGQNVVEEISPVTRGANLGWNRWEGSYRHANRRIEMTSPRSEAGLTWPIAEFDHTDPLLGRSAVTGVYVMREGAVPALRNKVIFGDNPSGEIFYVDADRIPDGGQAPLRRVLLNDGGTGTTLLQIIRARNAATGKPAAPRADLRMGMDGQGRLFLLNKRDGVIRVVVP